MHINMNEYQKHKLEIDFRNFTVRNFEHPSDCRNLDQIRFYVRELCLKIEEYETTFDYAPVWAYSLLAQYNLVQNRMLHREFIHAYPASHP
jgi:hypothetical protein